MRLEQRLTNLQHRREQAYLDKLDGKISTEFWQRKDAEWLAEETQIVEAINDSSGDLGKQHTLNASRILELAHHAYFLYLRQNPSEKAKLLRMVVSNCAIDAVNLYPVYRKPFDLIFQRAKTKEWRARRDSNS